MGEFGFKLGELLFELGSDLAQSPLAAERFARGLRARTNDLRFALERGEPTLCLVTTLLELVQAPERGV